MLKFSKSITAFFFVLQYFFAAVSVSDKTVEENIKYQQERMNYLKTEFYSNYTPCDESKFTDFDLEEALETGVKYNEVQFLATHNSYQIDATEECKQLYRAISDLTYGYIDTGFAEFSMDSLTEQFELGIRSVEIDIETVDKKGDVSFVVSHDSLYDNTSSCFNLELALEEIKMWSDHNPNHLPLTIIIEPKKNVPPIRDMKNFKYEYAKILDELVREKMGDTLLTPADMMGEYESLKEMRENDGWLPLNETMGKVIFLLHDSAATSGYINQDKSLKTQAMFPMLRFNDRNKSYASFIIDNEPDAALKHEEESIGRCNLIVRTRVDFFPFHPESRYNLANNCSSQIMSTDYPVRKAESKFHTYSFDGYTVKLRK